jgi:hypothetical protein
MARSRCGPNLAPRRTARHDPWSLSLVDKARRPLEPRHSWRLWWHERHRVLRHAGHEERQLSLLLVGEVPA